MNSPLALVAVDRPLNPPSSRAVSRRVLIVGVKRVGVRIVGVPMVAVKTVAAGDAKGAMKPAAAAPSPSDPRQILATAPSPMPHHGVPAKTSRARAVVDAAVAAAVAVAVAAVRRDVKRDVIGRFPDGWKTSNPPVVGPLRQRIATVLTSQWASG
jgi:hypothetical protein